jgi:hypothetical protein
MTRLIKWVELKLTYIVLYIYFDMIRTQYANINFQP